jgi:hypothetical protein
MAGAAVIQFTKLLTETFHADGVSVRPWTALPRRSRNVLIIQTPEKPTILYVKQSTNDPAFWGLTRNQIQRIAGSGNRWFAVLLRKEADNGYLLTGNQVAARTGRGDLTLSADGDFKVNEGTDLAAAQYFGRFEDFLARAFWYFILDFFERAVYARSADTLWRSRNLLWSMPTDEERFLFIAEFKLSIGWSDDGATLFWTGKPLPGQPGRLFVVAKGLTLDEATNAAIGRWEKKHKKRWSPNETPTAAQGLGDRAKTR